MTRTPRWLAVAATLGLGTGVLGAVPASAQPSPGQAEQADVDVLQVDLARATGDFRGGASGALYGLGDDGAPTQALINGAHITNVSQKAPFGTQHPSGDALQIEDGFFDKHGQDLYIYVQDYYPDWPYHGGQRPGDTRTYDLATGEFTDTPNGTWDFLEVARIVAEAVATESDRPGDYVFIPFNEPDGGNWYASWSTLGQTFLEDWDAVHGVIQEVWDAHGLGEARIGGPGDTRWQPERSEAFLRHTMASGTVPDVFIWHELGIDNLATFRGNYDAYRALEQRLGLEALHVNVTEWGMLRDMSTPGQLIQWFSIMEDLKIDGQVAYWNYAGNLSDNSARANAANAGWWMFKWYGDLEGSQTVAVTPPALNAVDTLQGIGAVDVGNRRATVLYGGGSKDVRVDLAGLDPAVFGGAVDVEVREVRLTGAEGVAATPRVIQAAQDVAVADGELALTVPTYDRYAGYQVVITPAQDREVAVDAVFHASVEAEDTALTDAQVYTQDPKQGGGWKFLASHGKDVGSFNRATSRADWTVEVPRDGTYRFEVVGAAPGVPGRHALFVDDAHAGTVQYAADLALNATSRWQYRGSAELEVALTAGEHVLSLRASEDGATLLPNADITLDTFALTDVTDGEPITYPASTLRLEDGAVLTWADGTRGWAALPGGDARADAYVHAASTGYHDVTVTYASTAASTVDVTVNGAPVATLEAPGAGTWSSTARLHLAHGINEVELRSPTGAVVRDLTTRATGDPGAALVVEAEDAQLRGNARVTTYAASTGSNASGSAGVGSIGQGRENAVVVDRAPGVDQPGTYAVTVRFANAEVSGSHDYNPQVVDRRLDVWEQGAQESSGYAYLRYTYAWTSFLERTFLVELGSGDASLEFGRADGWAPDLDRIEIAPLSTGAPTTVPVGGEELATWDPATVYVEGDRVTHGGAEWVASWWTQRQEPGDPVGPWQQIRTDADGTAVWTASRVFAAGDLVRHDGVVYEARWWTRNQVPGDPDGPWTRHG